jgi:hypothetical protein
VVFEVSDAGDPIGACCLIEANTECFHRSRIIGAVAA